MSQQSKHKLKRRPPRDEPIGDHEDADWGFDDDEVDPGLEKKLGMALVLCLMAGFGYVFYQKYQLRQTASPEEGVEVALNDPAADSVDESPGDGVESESSDSPSPSPAAPTESPFFNEADASVASAEDAAWTLAAADHTTADAEANEAPAMSLSPQAAGDRFDPFAEPEPLEPSAEPEEVPTIVWDDPPSPRPHSPAEPEPLQSGESTEAESESMAAADSQPMPSTVELPSTSAEPLEEAPLLLFGAPADEEAPQESNQSTPTVELFPQQQEPVDEEPATRTSPAPAESSSSVDDRDTQDEFDPFAMTAEPDAEEPSTASLPDPMQEESAPRLTQPGQEEPPAAASPPQIQADVQEEPFPFLAPPSQGEPPSPAAEPAPVAVSEPPAWPFNEGTQPDAGTSESNAEPPTLTIEPVQRLPDLPVAQAEPEMTINPGPPAELAAEPDNAMRIGEPAPPNPFSPGEGGPLPVVTPIISSQAVIGEREITVTERDSFWSISEREYGTPGYFTALARYNRNTVPQAERLQPGMIIRIPPPEVLESQFPDLFSSPSDFTEQVSQTSGFTPQHETKETGFFLGERREPLYRVSKSDTLSSIAQTYLGRSSRWTEIYDLNRDQLTSPSTLKIGMVLKLPADAGRVSASPFAGSDR